MLSFLSLLNLISLFTCLCFLLFPPLCHSLSLSLSLITLLSALPPLTCNLFISLVHCSSIHFPSICSFSGPSQYTLFISVYWSLVLSVLLVVNKFFLIFNFITYTDILPQLVYLCIHSLPNNTSSEVSFCCYFLSHWNVSWSFYF